MSEHKISEPIGAQSQDVLEWSRSLRSRSPSPSRSGLRSRSPSPAHSSSKQHTPRKGILNTDIPRPVSSRTPSAIMTSKSAHLRQSVDSALRKSTGGSMAVGFSTGKKKANADSIEAEYIKNLQQQIYFLELETNYLREQAKKATDMHPRMTAEAERMLSKLRHMQAEMDGLTVETRRKDESIGLIATEKEHLSERLRDEEDARVRDKRMLMDEIIDLKKTITKLESENSYKDSQLLDARNELDKSATALKNAETKIITMKSQLEQRIEQHKMTQINLDEKRSELLSMETQLRNMEEKYYNSTVTLQDKVTNDLRDEIRVLRQRQKEAEMTAEQERHLREKVSMDGSNIVRENASLNQQVVELSRQLEREKNLRDEIEVRHSGNISEIVQVKDREKEAKFELEYIQDTLRKEQEKARQLQEQVTFKDSQSTQQELQTNTARSRVTELMGLHEHLEKENIHLRKDKSLLVDHVADVQKKLEIKNEELVHLRSRVMALEQKTQEYQQFSSMELSSQSQKWSEFEHLAESMRTLSHTMATSTRSPRPTLSSGPLQY